MASSSSSIATLVAPPSFTGVSKFASGLQQVLSRAVAIASLPLQSLEAGLTDLNDRQSALQGLDTTFLSLQLSLNSLQSALNSSVLSSSVSDGSVVSANVQAGALPGAYSIEVERLGAYSTALSLGGSSPVTDPSHQGIGSGSSLTLSVGSSTTTITPASGSLQDLASAINSQAGGIVQATIVNLGSSGSPDYRLSLRASRLGNDSIDLADSSGGDLIANSSAGSLGSYKVNGSDAAISTDTRTVSLAPGLTVNLLGQSAAGVATVITVSNNPAGLASAFSSFASSYNAAADALNQYHGKGAGVLQGDSLLQSLSSVLHQLGTYSNGSPANALASFGITIDQTGHLSVDSAEFTKSANADFGALLTALGTSTSGGFLKTASDLLGGLEDPTNGLIKSEETSLSTRITSQQTKITNEQAVVTSLQTHLTDQITKADAAIAALESQVSYVTGLFAQYTGATNTQSNGLATL